MERNYGNQSSSNRRKVLQTIGSGIAGLAVAPATGSSKRSFEDHIEQARRLREKTGDHSRYVHYLRKHGFPTETWTGHYKVPVRQECPDGQVCSSKLVQEDLYVAMSGTKYFKDCDPTPYQAYIDYYFEWTCNDGGAGGWAEDPISISWPESHFYYERSLNGDYCTEYDHAGQYVVWNFSDADAGLGQGAIFDTSCGVYIRPGGYQNDQSTIYGKYKHTYDYMSIGDISVTPGGSISINLTSSENWIGGHDDLVWGSDNWDITRENCG